MVVRPGDIQWIDFGDPIGSSPGYRHPHVVVQNNAFNQSRLRTFLVCPLTPNLKRAAAPGNVLLDDGEAELPKRSVVNVSQLVAVDRSQIGDYMGTLSPKRVREIVSGIKLFVEPRDIG